MKIVIDIPEEFEKHFNKDRFSDSLARVASDIESFGFQLAGRYEQETITMIRKAFEQATPLEAQPTEKNCDNCGHKFFTVDCYECSDSYLNWIPKAQPTDAISREEAIFIVDEYAIGGETWAQRKDCVELLKQLPSVQPNVLERVNSALERVEDLLSSNDEIDKKYATSLLVQLDKAFSEMYMKGYEYGVKDWFKAKTQPCKDAVDRDAVIQFIKEWFKKINLNPDILIDSIICLPSVTPQTVTEFADKCKECGKIQKELCEDAISRKEVIAEIEKDDQLGFLSVFSCHDQAMAFTETIKELPPVQPKRKRGEWFIVSDFDGIVVSRKCSECDLRIRPNISHMNYCPNCGCQMGGENDETTD